MMNARHCETRAPIQRTCRLSSIKWRNTPFTSSFRMQITCRGCCSAQVSIRWAIATT